MDVISTKNFVSNPLSDSFGRTFPYLRLSVTDVCNFRCTYCLPNGYSGNTSNFLRVEEITRLVKAFACLGTKKVRLTGGEPTLRTDFCDIAKAVSSVSGIESIVMTTNGYKLPQKAKEFYDAGIRGINISIDGLSPERFKLITGKDRYTEVMAGLNICREIGFAPIKVNAVLLRDLDDNELDSFIAWAETGINLRFIELMETGDNREYFENNHLGADILINKLTANGWSEKKPEAMAGPARVFEHNNSPGSVGVIAPYSKDFCVTCNRLRISARGKLHLCLFGETGYDLRPLLQADDQSDELQTKIRKLLMLKESGHGLHQHDTGATPHFASIGG